MGNLNTVTMSGNLTKDPEWRDFDDSGVAGLRLAVNERFKDKSGEWTTRGNFFDWAAWRGLGKWCVENLKKGDLVVVTGRAQWREWEQDGQKRQAVSFVATDIEMGASRRSAPSERQPAAVGGGSSDPLPFDDDITFRA